MVTTDATIGREPDSGLAIKHVDAEERRVVAWAYVARKADGTLAMDSVGTTKVGDEIVDSGSDRDVVDTPDAIRALKAGFYGYLSREELVGAAKVLKRAVRSYLAIDGGGTKRTLRAALKTFEDSENDAGMDDMHEEFEVAKAIGGVFIEPDLSAALISGQETYKALVAQAEALAGETDAEKRQAGATALAAALKAYPAQALPTGALLVSQIPRTDRGDELWTAIKSGARQMLSIVAPIRRQVIADAA